MGVFQGIAEVVVGEGEAVFWNYAFSMPKLGVTRAKTDQLESAHLAGFRGFSRRLLVGVSVRIALIGLCTL